MPKSKKAVNRLNPKLAKIPRTYEDVAASESQNFTWKIHKNYIDIGHDEWGWNNFGFRDFVTIILRRFHDYETMTWQQICLRPSFHPKPINEISTQAQSRIMQLFNDIDTLHQLDVSEFGRVWGYRKRGTFYLIWYDPKHTVCPFK